MEVDPGTAVIVGAIDRANVLRVVETGSRLR
jgi:hypothetical protein